MLSFKCLFFFAKFISHWPCVYKISTSDTGDFIFAVTSGIKLDKLGNLVLKICSLCDGN